MTQRIVGTSRVNPEFSEPSAVLSSGCCLFVDLFAAWTYSSTTATLSISGVFVRDPFAHWSEPVRNISRCTGNQGVTLPRGTGNQSVGAAGTRAWRREATGTREHRCQASGTSACRCQAAGSMRRAWLLGSGNQGATPLGIRARNSTASDGTGRAVVWRLMHSRLFCSCWETFSVTLQEPSFSHFENIHCHTFGRFWGGLRDLGAFRKSQQIWCEPNQITHRQGLPKVCVQQFHSQDEDQFRFFQALLIHFGLGIMLEERIWEVQFFGFVRSNSSNLEVWKIYGLDVEISPHLWRYKYFVKEVHWWIVVYCMGIWEVAFNFWFLKIFKWFLGGG